MGQILTHFVNEYFVACEQNPEATPAATSRGFLSAAQLALQYGLGPKHFRFGTTHTAIRGGEEMNEGNIDFYRMGCDFFKPAMNLEESAILGQDNLERAFSQMAAGENVVFLANHQSEADPQVFSTLLERIGWEEEAAKIVYVAGHKVTTDPLAIPFSMGRNLICIHSKKHIYADPETQPMKQKQNLAAMSGMLEMMRRGGLGLWVAPSGGRDRRDLDTGKVPIASFDQKTIDMFRLMSNKSKVTTHFYPLAMFSYDLCPPPDFVEAGVGESRNVRYTPVGIACGDEIMNVGGVEARHVFSENAESACSEQYDKLVQAIEDNKAKASSSSPPPL
jgi:glycerol-3-phosphate O-acyltransferase